MKLVPVIITEEILGDTQEFAVTADGQLDLDSGDITIKDYYTLTTNEKGESIKTPYDVVKEKLPAKHEEYDFTSGLLKMGDKEVEFAVNVDVDSGQYEVSADELAEIKEKAVALVSKAPLKKDKKKNV